MQFTTIAITLFAAAVTASPLNIGLGHGPVVSGGSCAADTAAAIPLRDCLKVLSDLRTRGDNDHVQCDRVFRTEYNYAANGACQVVATKNGDPQCMNPKDVADGLEEILGLCGQGQSVLPGQYQYFMKGTKISIVKA